MADTGNSSLQHIMTLLQPITDTDPALGNMTTSVGVDPYPSNVTLPVHSADADPYPGLRQFVNIAHIYVIPVIIAVGLVGNLANLLLLFSDYMRDMGMSVYLAALAVSDSVFLLTLIIIWLEYIDIQIFHTQGLCQAVIYLSYCSSFLSSWFVVGVTVDRFIAICFPLQRVIMCTVHRARIIVSMISVVGALLYCCTLWIEGVDTITFADYEYELCTTLKEYENAHRILMYVDTVVTLILPYATVFALNIMLVINIARLHKEHRKLTQYSLRPITETESSGDQEPHHEDSRCIYSRAQHQITRMLLSMSTVFLLINTPSYSVRLYVFFRSFSDYMNDTAETIDPQSELFMLIQQLFQLMYYTNYAIDFWVYSLSSTNFRRILCRYLSDSRERMAERINSVKQYFAFG